MPSYTILVQSGRSRMLRHGSDGTGTVVTTIPDHDRGAAIAAALTEATTDLPHQLVCYLLDELDLWHLTISEWNDSGTRTDWEDLPAERTTFSLRRRALTVLDHGEQARTDPETGISKNQLHALLRLRETLQGQPQSVVRAVRDEVAEAFAPYDQPPVVARAYDYKYGECDQVFVANAGLARMAPADLAGLRDRTGAPGVRILDALEKGKLADFSYADQTAMSGYLDVDVNRAQLEQWLDARQASPTSS